MNASLGKSIIFIKQKVEKCDEIMYIITLFIIQWPKNLSFSGINTYY